MQKSLYGVLLETYKKLLPKAELVQKNGSYISSDVKIGTDVEIAPFCVIGADVQIGDHCKIGAGTIIKDHVRIGSHAVSYTHLDVYKRQTMRWCRHCRRI